MKPWKTLTLRGKRLRTKRALECLGTSLRAVRSVLRAGKFIGRRSNFNECPIARYLESRGVDHYGVEPPLQESARGVVIELGEDEDGDTCVPLPFHVREFVERFDAGLEPRFDNGEAAGP
jgi:hypothetical protein